MVDLLQNPYIYDSGTQNFLLLSNSAL